MKAINFTSENLGDYCQKFYIWDTCPIVQRRIELGKNMSQYYVETQRARLEKFILPDNTICKIPFRELKRGDLLDFRTRLRKDCSPSSVNRTFGVLKTILREAYFRGDIEHEITAGTGNISIKSKEKGIFTVEELQRMFDPIDHPWRNERARIAFLLMADTGMRTGEVLGLQWKHVDFENGIVRIERAWKRDGFGPTKSSKPRKTGMTNRLCSTLLSYMQDVLTCLDNHLVICWDNGTHLSPEVIAKYFKRAMEKMSIDKKSRNLSPHAFRHSIITHMRQANIDMDLLKANIGHSDLKTTDGYTHYEDSFIRKYADKWDEILSSN